MTRRPLYRCAACDQVKVRRIGERCTECVAARRPAQPLVLSSVAKQRRKARQALAKRNLCVMPEQPRRLHAKADSPYERAVAIVERTSGRPRAAWEHQYAHPLTLAANQVARKLAGIAERPTRTPHGAAA